MQAARPEDGVLALGDLLRAIFSHDCRDVQKKRGGKKKKTHRPPGALPPEMRSWYPEEKPYGMDATLKVLLTWFNLRW